MPVCTRILSPNLKSEDMRFLAQLFKKTRQKPRDVFIQLNISYKYEKAKKAKDDTDRICNWML